MWFDLESFLFLRHKSTDNHTVPLNSVILNLSLQMIFTGNYCVTLVRGDMCKIFFYLDIHEAKWQVCAF
jgi:hypothetical protein